MPNSFIPTRLNDLTVDVSLSSVARGDVLYRGASKWNNLAAGTSGKFLRTNGAGADPSWETAGVTDHGALTGLSDDDHTIYALLAGRSGGQTINGDTASGGNIRIDSTAHATKGEVRFNSAAGAKVTADSRFSCDGGFGNGDEYFGNGAGPATATAGRNTIIGALAGNTVTAGASSNVIIGTYAGGSFGTAVSGVSNILIGDGARPSAAVNNVTCVGRDAAPGHDGVILLGGYTSSTAANQCVIGSGDVPISTVYVGKGPVHATPAEFTLNATGGSGTNIAGANFYAAGGRPTGSANGGSFIIQTAAPGASGTTLRDLVDRVTVDTNGLVTIAGNLTAANVNTGTVTASGNVNGSGWLRAGAASYVYWDNRTNMTSPSDGVLRLANNAESDFNRIQLGGTTSSFPAIKRNAAALALRLADDSADAAFSAAGATLSGDVLPATDDTYYLGKNDDDSPKAWKGVILKDTTNGKYYRIEVISGVVTATDLTD